MPIHSLILSLNDTTKTHNSPIHSHANRAASKSRLALAWCDISAIIDIKPLFVMRGVFGGFLLMTIFFLTLMLIADKSFYSVV